MPGQQCSIPRSTQWDWYYLPTFGYIHVGQWVDRNTLQGINISHLGKRKIIFKMPFLGDMLVPWRVYHTLKIISKRHLVFIRGHYITNYSMGNPPNYRTFALFDLPKIGN